MWFHCLGKAGHHRREGPRVSVLPLCGAELHPLDAEVLFLRILSSTFSISGVCFRIQSELLNLSYCVRVNIQLLYIYIYIYIVVNQTSDAEY